MTNTTQNIIDESIKRFDEKYSGNDLLATKGSYINSVLDSLEIELEAWMNVHQELQKTFKTDDLLSHMRKTVLKPIIWVPQQIWIKDFLSSELSTAITTAREGVEEMIR